MLQALGTIIGAIGTVGPMGSVGSVGSKGTWAQWALPYSYLPLYAPYLLECHGKTITTVRAARWGTLQPSVGQLLEGYADSSIYQQIVNVQQASKWPASTKASFAVWRVLYCGPYAAIRRLGAHSPSSSI